MMAGRYIAMPRATDTAANTSKPVTKTFTISSAKSSGARKSAAL